MVENDHTESVASESSASNKKKSSFAGDVLKLVTGTTFAQVLGILIAPILTRLYAPEAFGTLALFMSVIGIVQVISCLRYELSIMLPQTDEEAANLLGVSLASATGIALVAVPVIALGGHLLADLLNAPKLAVYLWLVPPMVLVNGFFLALNYWNSRTKHFGRLSIARVTKSLTAAGGKLGAGLSGLASGGSLILANFAGASVSTLILGGQIWRDDRELLRRSIHFGRMVAGVKRYRKFPLFTTWAGLLNVMSWQLPNFFLSAFFSTTVVGYYALGDRVLRLPMSLVGGAIAQVFFQRASEARNEGDLNVIVENVFRRLVKLGLWPALMLIIIGSDLFVFIFGPEWAEAGVYVQILGGWTFFWFISSPLSTLFSVLERQEIGLYLQVVIFGSRLLALAVGGYWGSPRVALALFGLSGILVYGFLCLLILHLSRVSVRRALDILIMNLLLFVPVGITLLGLQTLDFSHLFILITAFSASVVYFFFVIKTDRYLSQLSKEVFTKMKLGKD